MKAADKPSNSPSGVVLYDGHCDFCTKQAERLIRYAGDRVRLVSFQDKGALDPYRDLTHADCMKEIKLVDPRHHIYGGAEAIVRSINLGHPVTGKLLFAYYLPIVRQIADRAYRWVATNRYRLAVDNPDACRTGECRRHTD
ncbi:MAG: DUF393 domain-containing protein [bacterium]|nr:DUF393 domain-containing protein [bacterium]